MSKPPLAHILIVEDDSELLEVLKFVLEDDGYEVSLASTGAQAFKTISAKPVDLVVLDVNLSGESGLGIARELRARSESSRIRIALHTGSAEDAIRAQFSDYDLFMPKGDDAEAFLKSIAVALAGQREPAASPP